MKYSNQLKAYFFAGLSILAWSSISTAFKLSLINLTPLGLLFFASLTAAAFLGSVRLLSKPHSSNPGSIIVRIGKNVRLSLLPALLNPFLYYLMLFEAYSRLRAQEAQALNYTWAIVLALFSIILLKEKFRILDFIALLISFVGVWIISTKGAITNLQFDDALGSFLAVFTSLIWALYWILSLKDQRDATTKLFFNFSLGFIFIAVLVMAGKASLFTPGANIIHGLIGGVYVGIFEMGLTFLLWFKALQYTSSTAKVSNLIFLTPFVSLLFISRILGESIHPATFIGLIMIVFSNLVQKGVFSFSKRNA